MNQPRLTTQQLNSFHYTSPLFHQHNYYIVSLLLATVMLTKPSSPLAWKALFLMPYESGIAAQFCCAPRLAM
jgi:hypothetical protein